MSQTLLISTSRCFSVINRKDYCVNENTNFVLKLSTLKILKIHDVQLSG